MENKSLKEKIRIKYLLNEKGELDEKLSEFVKNSEFLINYGKIKFCFDSPLFFLKFDKVFLLMEVCCYFNLKPSKNLVVK